MTTQQPTKNQTQKGLALLLATMTLIVAVVTSIALGMRTQPEPLDFTTTGASSTGIGAMSLTTTGLAEAGIQ